MPRRPMPTSAELVKAKPPAVMSMLHALEEAGAITATGLTLDKVDLTYEAWEALGKFLGSVRRSADWWIGDWINHGEEAFGQEASQAVDATTADRYDIVQRVTGLAPGTLHNIATICRLVARSRRRPELPFFVHAEVTKLEPDEQVEWLQKAIDENWSRDELRDAIRNAYAPPANDGGGSGSNGDGDHLSHAERVEAAARVVWETGQPSRGGDFRVPGESWAMLGAALGEGE